MVAPTDETASGPASYVPEPFEALPEPFSLEERAPRTWRRMARKPRAEASDDQPAAEPEHAPVTATRPPREPEPIIVPVPPPAPSAAPPITPRSFLKLPPLVETPPAPLPEAAPLPEPAPVPSAPAAVIAPEPEEAPLPEPPPVPSAPAAVIAPEPEEAPLPEPPPVRVVPAAVIAPEPASRKAARPTPRHAAVPASRRAAPPAAAPVPEPVVAPPAAMPVPELVPPPVAPLAEPTLRSTPKPPPAVAPAAPEAVPAGRPAAAEPARQAPLLAARASAPPAPVPEPVAAPVLAPPPVAPTTPIRLPSLTAYEPEPYDPQAADVFRTGPAIASGQYAMVYASRRTGRGVWITLLLIAAVAASFVVWRVQHSGTHAPTASGVEYHSTAGHFTARFPAQPTEVAKTVREGHNVARMHRAAVPDDSTVIVATDITGAVPIGRDRAIRSILHGFSGGLGMTITGVRTLSFHGHLAQEGSYLTPSGQLLTVLVAAYSVRHYYLLMAPTGDVYNTLRDSFAVEQ